MSAATGSAEPLVCEWPRCGHSEVSGGVVLALGREWVRCLCHLVDDDCCPTLRPGPMAACYACGGTTVLETDGRVPLHEWCRRTYAMAQVAVPARGSYARRRARGSGGTHAG